MGEPQVSRFAESYSSFAWLAFDARVEVRARARPPARPSAFISYERRKMYFCSFLASERDRAITFLSFSRSSDNVSLNVSIARSITRISGPLVTLAIAIGQRAKHE
jgi:hypothetical protein